MITPVTITTAMVTKLRLIPALVTALGVSSKIFVHDERGSLADSIRNLEANELLVAWQQSVPGEMGPLTIWEHQVSVFFRVYGDPSTAISAVLTGVPTGEASAFHRLTLTAGLLPSTTPTVFRRQLPISETAAVDYIEIQFSYGDYDRP